MFLAKNNLDVTNLRHRRYPEIEQIDCSHCTYAWGVNKRNKVYTFPVNVFVPLTFSNCVGTYSRDNESVPKIFYHLLIRTNSFETLTNYQ